MDDLFGFLARAKPASLFRLLEKLPLEDVAIVLAGLPAGQGVQAMAFFPENVQAELMPAMREARRIDPARAAKTADLVRKTIESARNARVETAAKTPAPPAAAPLSTKPAAPSARPSGNAAPINPVHADRGYPPAPRRPHPAGDVDNRPVSPSASRSDASPRPWKPRSAASSPINGPALPGKPPPVSGDPLQSPLAKAGLLDLIGRAKDKLFAKNPEKSPAPPTRGGGADGKRIPPPLQNAASRPPAREGMAPRGVVRVEKTPRVIGLPAARPPLSEPGSASGGARRMDGKAILAAILRTAGPELRDAVRRDDPSLYRELRGRMFYFDDLLYTEDGALARVFTAAPAAESALALKFAAPALRERVLRAVSPGRAAALRDVPPGRTGFDAVENAQKKVLDVALQLQAAGRILIDPRDPDLAKQ